METQEQTQFPAVLTPEQMTEAGGEILQNHNVAFRIALMVLTKSSEELTEITLKDADSKNYEDMAVRHMLHLLNKGEETARAHLETFEAANARLKASILNAGRQCGVSV